jgi:hypothetical protein
MGKSLRHAKKKPLTPSENHPNLLLKDLILLFEMIQRGGAG